MFAEPAVTKIEEMVSLVHQGEVSTTRYRVVGLTSYHRVVGAVRRTGTLMRRPFLRICSCTVSPT
jgi:hypothetical protein